MLFPSLLSNENVAESVDEKIGETADKRLKFRCHDDFKERSIARGCCLFV